MQTIFRTPQIENGLRNLILQNRAGNRLTLLAHEQHVELEVLYKPNAFRRSDYRARNFSDRDNCTALFRAATLPDVHAADIADWGYDPFTTRLGLSLAHGAANRLTVVNVADENVFAIAARCPLVLTFAPHRDFIVRDGLLLERFHDRGEDIVAFVRFTGFVHNRYRRLDDGTHVLQLVEDDVVLFGGEENDGQVQRVLDQLAPLSLEQLIARNERVLAPWLAQGRVTVADPSLQRVADLNRRVCLSGMDAGGACFGALNRIYHLIWVRDGSMTSCHMAQAGNPEFIRTWAPFLLANPSWIRGDDGVLRPEFVQILGTRWTKSEDDGIFYATWSAYTHFTATGDDRLVQGEALPVLITAIDRYLDKVWDEARGMAGSDTLGEDPLAGNPYYGYDVVNGSIERGRQREGAHAEAVSRCFSLYQQVNVYNVLRMAAVLVDERPALDGGRRARWLALAARIVATLRQRFATADGLLLSHLAVMQDGSERWQPFGIGCDYWETAWAVSQGPFFPVPELQLATARHIVATWSSFRAYGFCPWNTLARMLAEHGLGEDAWREHLAQELREALLVTQRYPMPGALTEYAGAVESWRGLPFSAGSLLAATCAQALFALPQGLAVRGGAAVTAVEDYRWRLARISLEATGTGDSVARWTLNGQPVRGSLQIPEGWLRAGRNRIQVERGPVPPALRLRRSDAAVVDLREDGDGCRLVLRSIGPIQAVFDGSGEPRFADEAGRPLQTQRCPLPGSGSTAYTLVDHPGTVVVTWPWP